MYNPAINHQLSTSADAPARLHRLVRRYSVGKSVMRKVDQYLEDRQIRNRMSDKRNEKASRLPP